MKEKAESGLSRERLNRLATAISKDVEAGRYDGGVILVARHGIVGLQEAIGFTERGTNRPCRLDDVFNIMSVTKAFTDVILLSKMEHRPLSCPVSHRQRPAHGTSRALPCLLYHLLKNRIQKGSHSGIRLLL